MNDKYANEIITWQYDKPYSIYNYINSKDFILDKSIWGRDLFAVLSEQDELK